MSTDLIEAVVLVLLGGVFGWTLGKLPDRYVYVVLGVAILLGIVVLDLRLA